MDGAVRIGRGQSLPIIAIAAITIAATTTTTTTIAAATTAIP